MRLGYLTSLYARAADTFIRGEVAELRRRGHRVHTFSIRKPDRGEVVSEQIRAERDRTHYVLAQGPVALLGAFLACWLRRPRSMLASASLAWRTRAPGLRGWIWQLAYWVEAAWIARSLERLGIEHLHDHIGQNSATVAMLAAAIARVPWSFTVHGPDEFFMAQHIALPAKLRDAAFTVCVSEFGRSQCMLWSPPELWRRLHVVRCGLDAPLLTAPLERIPDRARLLCVGRLAEQKGLPVLVDAVAQLRDEGLRCEVDLAGDGPLRAPLEAQIRRLGLDKEVRLLGWRSGEGVRDALRGARALVLPSLAEGLPVVAMEALSRGRPVVATWVAGIPELVEPGVSGWLVPPGSARALAAAIRDVLLCPTALLEEMGRAGAVRVRERHDRAREVAKLDALMTDPAARAGQQG